MVKFKEKLCSRNLTTLIFVAQILTKLEFEKVLFRFKVL